MPLPTDSGSGASAEQGSESGGQSDTLEGPHDAFEEAKRKVVAEVQEAREDSDRQLRKLLCHVVNTHEVDRAINLDRILLRVSLEYSKDVFQRLQNYIRFPQFIKKIDYYQGGTSSVAFTDRRPPGYWLPMLTHDDPLDQGGAEHRRRGIFFSTLYLCRWMFDVELWTDSLVAQDALGKPPLLGDRTEQAVEPHGFIVEQDKCVCTEATPPQKITGHAFATGAEEPFDSSETADDFFEAEMAQHEGRKPPGRRAQPDLDRFCHQDAQR
ncbi:hypothetical protein ColKHC_13079 [Colletotrichum higginsianum]|nr:hypothetical protein ColKHC_13079 [Colletotrichum higginsianum]